MESLWDDPAPYLRVTSTPSTQVEADAATERKVVKVASSSLLPSRDKTVREAPPRNKSEDPPAQITRPPPLSPDWRLKDRMKTVGVGLVLCLNIGTDPPDVIKPQPCAKLQCWMDPGTTSRSKAKEVIADRLESQYSKWQLTKLKANQKMYKKVSDGTVDDVRAMCMSLRRQARHERVLLHYNGHGVPKPTPNGELWVFDRQHSEYIPLSVMDISSWLGRPSMVVLDCSSAGVLVPFLVSNAPHPPTAADEWAAWSSNLVKDTIVLAACSAGETLPLQPDYPADIFTCCLTTPIQIALRWFVRRNPLSMGQIDPDSVDQIPGKANDRKTPLGELNWIFTAVTDSIAWNVLPRVLFQRLFRQDLMVASMFRNYLLAQRILPSLGCTPVSHPPLPLASHHNLWEAWDLACEQVLVGLAQQGVLSPPLSEGGAAEAPPAPSIPPTVHLSSPFFSEQLTAFEMWLRFSQIHRRRLEAGEAVAPEQLPIVLQVLLSQIHRVRALQLLRQFLDLGPWAVNVSLSLGIFPYVMKLLQSPEYKSLLVSIWATILSFDPSYRTDLLKDNAFHHFVQHLMWGLHTRTLGAARERTLAAYVLSVVCHKYPAGQSECVRLGLYNHCCALLSSYEQGESSGDASVELHLPDDFRLWVSLVLANMVQGNTPVQSEAYHAGVHARLSMRLSDKSPDVRAAVCFAFGCLIGAVPKGVSGSRQSSTEDLLKVQQQAQRSSGSFAQGAPVVGQQMPTGAANIVLPGTTAPAVPLQPTFSTAVVPNLNWRPAVEPVRGEQLPLQPQYVVPPGVGLAQPQSSLGGPSGFMVGANPMVPHGQLPLLSPQQPSRPPQPEAPRSSRASIFEDHTRLDNDLYSMECLKKACSDGSVNVRYEAVIALSTGVAKYLDGFAVAAEEVAGEEDRSSLSRTSFPVPQGLDRRFIKRFAAIYKALRSLQRLETFPMVAKVASDAISAVHEQLLVYQIEQEHRGELLGDLTLLLPTNKLKSMLSGIDEDGDGASADMTSSLHSSKASTPKLAPSTIPTKSEIRRVASEMVSGASRSMETEALMRRVRLSEQGDDSKFEPRESKFYSWKKSQFVVDSESSLDNSRDLLNPVSARRSQTSIRNELRRKEGAELAKKYKTLLPKPVSSRRHGIELALDDEDTEAAETEASRKKSELEMVETELIKNPGVKMTSMLQFHAYEDVLVACGATDSVSVFNTTNGKLLNSFLNMNSQKTKMTSSLWINEDTHNSLFLIGCDDGSVRIWGDLCNQDGGATTKPPRLISSFFATSTGMEGRRNGLACEWQPWSNTLLAGGGGKTVDGWDLQAEKKIIQLESTANGTVTTLTTAWDVDQLGVGSAPYNGIGRDVLVAGHSDGSIKLFDLRAHNEALSIQGSSVPARSRRKRITEYLEHSSWVVSTSFRGYDGRYQLISSTVGGQIKAWDLRMSTSIRTIEAQRSPLTTCAVHPRVPIIATGSRAQFIKLLTLDGETMQVIRYHEKMQNNRIGHVSCVAFHRHKPLMAAGATDTYIGLFCSRNQVK